MKAIIYAGIGLFSVATVYGVADYYSSQKKGILDNLYKEEEPLKETVNSTGNTTVIPVKNSVTNVSVNKTMALTTSVKKEKKVKQPKRKMRLEDFSRGRIPEPIPVEPMPVDIKKETPPKVDEIKIKEEALKQDVKITQPAKPERRITMDMFSRAPLRPRLKADTTAKVTRSN